MEEPWGALNLVPIMKAERALASELVDAQYGREIVAVEEITG